MPPARVSVRLSFNRGTTGLHRAWGSRASGNAFELCRRHRRPKNAAIRPVRVNPIDVVANLPSSDNEFTPGVPRERSHGHNGPAKRTHCRYGGSIVR